MRDSRPIIAITMGDAAGIGPEIIMKAIANPDIYQTCRPLLIGDKSVMERACNLLNSQVRLYPVGHISDCKFESGALDLIDLKLLQEPPAFGILSKAAGHAAFNYVRKAVEMGMAGQIDAICTAPLNKTALHSAGIMYPGHTEILADLMGIDEYAMMLSTPGLRVIHVTTHIGLLDAVRKITTERVYQVIRLAHQTLVASGIQHPSIAVCGINPHAGEGGLFGYGEEEVKIVPAVKQAVQEGIQVVGPLPADTLFYRAIRGDFDIVVAMYHDQGHGPVKVLGLESGVNITVGLPILRTSVDHGTAFDIAGTGQANEASMREAVLEAARLTASK